MHRHATTSRRITLGLPKSVASSGHSLTRQYASRPPTELKRNGRPERPSELELKRWMKFPERAAQEEKGGWKHTPDRRCEEKRLAAALQTTKPSQYSSSMEKQLFEAELVLDAGEIENDSTFPLGSFVETRRNLQATTGVSIGSTIIDRRTRIIILTSTGEIWMPVRQDILFSIPAVAPLDLVHRCGDGEFTTKPNEIHARIELLKRIRAIERDTEKAYNAVCRWSRKIYDTVKASDPEKWSQTTVGEAARLNGQELGIISMFAAHRYMMNNPIQFVADDAYESNQRFHVRPQAHIDEIHEIQQWSRLRNGPIQSFAETARKATKINKAAHAKSSREKPSYNPAEHLWTWTPTDKVILSFLRRSLRRTRSSQNDPYSLGQSAILKAINPNRPPIKDDAVHETLVDLGIMAPWQDLTILEPGLALDLDPEAMSSKVKARDALVEKALSFPPTKGPLGPEDFHSSDPLESVRHDFGDMPVFVIDGANAEELDDGVSIERVPSEPDNAWVHVHIADPASVIPPTHILAKDASVQLESNYFIHRSWPLFPRRLMNDEKHGLSLGSRRDPATNVLTFSTKVNAQGEVLDYKVRAGIAREFRIISYDDADRLLGLPERPCQYPYGRKPSEPTRKSDLAEADVSRLRDLFAISNNVVAKRQRDGVWAVSYPIVELSSYMPTSDIKSPTSDPSIFRGFPEFEYIVMNGADADTGSRALVSEMMKLACRAASRFCSEKGIPALRRVSDPKYLQLSGDLQTLLDLRSPNNYVPNEMALQFVEILPPAEYALEAGPHGTLGVPAGEGYVRVTSPLRRYIDLVAHWQIHHALLGDLALTRSPPFDSVALSEMARTVMPTEKYKKSLEKNHRRFWHIMLLKRWIEDTKRGIIKGNDVLDNLEAVVVGVTSINIYTRKFHAEVYLKQFGVHAMLEGLDSMDLLRGLTFPVKIDECRLGVRPGIAVSKK